MWPCGQLSQSTCGLAFAGPALSLGDSCLFYMEGLLLHASVWPSPALGVQVLSPRAVESSLSVPLQHLVRDCDCLQVL